MNNMHTVSAQIVTPHTCHVGIASCRSPKQATRLAKEQATRLLRRWDNEHSHCSSIGMEWLVMSRDGKIIHSEETDIM
jgi:hypothetical protein